MKTETEKGRLITMVLSKEDERNFTRLSEKLRLNRSDTIRQAVNQYEGLEDIAINAQRNYERLLKAIEKMWKQNTKPELLTNLAEDILGDLGEVFQMERKDVLSALVLDNFARRTAFKTVYPDALIPFPEFSKANGEYMKDEVLFEHLKKKYTELYEAHKAECLKRGADDILKESGQAMPVLSKN